MATTPTSYKGSLHIEPLFGSEQDTYLRLIYGSSNNSTHGITPGLFWDLRSLPLPYQPLTSTAFKVITDDSAQGTLFRVQITRENPTQVPTTDFFDFVQETPEHIIHVYLGLGLNVLDVFVLDTDGQRQIASASYTSTNYATIMYSYALMIYNHLRLPYTELETSLTGPGSTGLVSPLIDFDSELPEPQNMFRLARQRIISAMINQPNSTQATQTIASALFQQTVPTQSPVHESELDLNVDWLRPVPTASQTHNTTELHVWQLDKELARWSTYARYLAGQGLLMNHSLSVTESHSDFDTNSEWLSTTRKYVPKQPAPMTGWMEGEIVYV